MNPLLDPTTRSLRRLILDRQRTGRVPGVLGAVSRHGELLWCEGVGASDLDHPDTPPDHDTQFLIASNTKTFTAVLVMQLRDEGKLSLDDTLDMHIPESGHRQVTIRQMLTHTSGMQREPVGDIWETLENPDSTQLVKGFAEAERILKPHFRWHYSNLVYAMLGELVARVDGRPWRQALEARILRPLEMRRTTVGPVPPHAQGYYVPPFSDVPVPEPVLELQAMEACGGLASTADDLARWSGFVADPVAEVLAPDTMEEMMQPQIMADTQGWTRAYGLGFSLLRHGERTFVGHTGGLPGHITGVFTDRESGTGAMVLMNHSAAPDPALAAADLLSYVLDHDPEEPPVWRPGTAVPEELQGVLGRWFSEGGGFTFSVREGRLEARVDGAPAATPPSVFTRVEPDLYRTESGRETGELLRITRDSDGTVTKMNWATYLFTREPYAFGQWRHP